MPFRRVEHPRLQHLVPLPQPAAQDNTLSELLELINCQLTEKNLKIEKASTAVIDATIIQTAGSKQRQAIEVDEEGQVSGQTTPSKDKDARRTKKNGLYKLGYKQHTRTDEEGCIRKLHITPANTHECKHLSPLLEGIALAAAAFMLRQGGAVVEAFVHVLAGGLGRTTKGALIEAVAAFQAAAVAGTDTHAAGAVAAFVAEVFKKGAADIGVDASGMGLGTIQHGIALAAELQFVGLQQGVLMGLAVGAVFAFAVGGFGIDIDAGLRTDGNPDADLYAGIAVFAVLMLAVLGRLQPDIACGIEADGVARGNVAASDGNVALAAADIDVATGFQAALLALAVVLVLFFAGGFKAEAGFNG